QPDAGAADLHPRAVAVPGDADDLLRVPAVDPAVRFHVSVRRHAALGAMAGRGVAADPLPAPDPWRDTARCQLVGAVAGRAGTGGFQRGDDDGRGAAFPQAAGLSTQAGQWGFPHPVWMRAG